MVLIAKSNLIILVFLFSSCFLGYSQISNGIGKIISQTKSIVNEAELKKTNFIE